ncbi:MAG: dihydropteroate synthase [Dehalococcoidia bacterium]|nr:dihydropteroate synthase [Dehalococcoidia bacterium]
MNMKNRGITKCGKTEFVWGSRTYIMGIINVTPDSFSGDGFSYDVGSAVEQGLRFVSEGADILDIGGESTRPGNTPVTADEEIKRVIPVISALSKQTDVPLSIDSYKTEVARQAVDAGASILNDVWGLKQSPELAQLAANHNLPMVIMHNQEGTQYRSMLDDILSSLRASIKEAEQAGVSSENIIIDPGIGFGKTWEQNLVVMHNLARFQELGKPMLLGTSRKSFIGRVLDLPVERRLEGTAATVSLSIVNGADIIRVHDVKAMARVAKMTDAMVRLNNSR